MATLIKNGKLIMSGSNVNLALPLFGAISSAERASHKAAAFGGTNATIKEEKFPNTLWMCG